MKILIAPHVASSVRRFAAGGRAVGRAPYESLVPSRLFDRWKRI